MNTMKNRENSIRTAGAHCCICKEGIEFEVDADNVAINPTGFDPCGLGFVTNVFGPRDGQREQWFYCHAECFRKVVNDKSIMYILEPGFETLGEFRAEQEHEEAEASAADVA